MPGHPHGGVSGGAGPEGFDPFQMFFGPAGMEGAGADPHLAERLFSGAHGFAPPAPQQSEQQKGPPPTSAATLRSLPKIKVKPYDLIANESNECSICLEDLVAGQPALRIPCGHLYHEECVKDWLRKSNVCPVCRFELPTDDAEYERGRRMRMAGRKLRMRQQDLTVKTVQELQRLANFIAVDVKGCLEKSELVDRIAASPKVQIIPADGSEGASASSASSGTPTSGQPICSPMQLEAFSIPELKALMERLGIDFNGCLEKAEMIQRLVLSGRILVINDVVGEATGMHSPAETRPEPSSLREMSTSSDVVMGDANESGAQGSAAGQGADQSFTGTTRSSPTTGTAEGLCLTGKSVGELRQLAQRLGVSLDGCLEKGELVQRIQAASGSGSGNLRL